MVGARDFGRAGASSAFLRKSNNGEIVIYNQELGHLVDIPSNSVDLVVAVSSLEHNKPENLKLVVSELMRVLKPGGALLATLGAASEADWFHVPSKGWCYTEATLRSSFDLPPGTPSNYADYDRLFERLRTCDELRNNLASFYARSGDKGMPWGVWDPKYQPVGVAKIKRDA
jgi:SAM-dependent methyltransferase